MEERFASVDPAKWIVLGEPHVVEGHLDTHAPGGWEHFSGIATRQAFDLDDERPLVLEFELTPLKMGVDSQLVASATETGALSYRSRFTARHTIWHLHAKHGSAAGPWENLEPGWKPRAFGPPVEINVTYRVMAEITQRTWRVTVGRAMRSLCSRRCGIRARHRWTNWPKPTSSLPTWNLRTAPPPRVGTPHHLA